MKKLLVFVLLGGFVLPSTSSAIDLKQAKFTQVVSSVDVISAADKSRHAASVNDTFKMPDMVRTGPASRAELIGSDDTITRVGANTVFSFDPANRTIDLQQGSLLFHAPHGKGGGTIHTGSATASVLGTTIIVATTPNGGFKVLVLEGEAEIRFLNGQHLTLTPGQMTFILPGGGTSPIVVFRLDDETKGSLLVSGFNNPLPSWPKILTEVTRQLLLLLNNKLQDTDLVVGDNATPDAVQVRVEILPQSPFYTDSSIIGVDKTANDTLPVNYPPLDPAHVEIAPFTPPAFPSFIEGWAFLQILDSGIGNTPASGFVGRNVDIDTGWNVPIDLSSFAGNSDFDIMAAQDLRIWQSVIFTGNAPEADLGGSLPDTITLFAGGKMLVAQYSTLEADTGTFGLVADSFGVLDISTDSSAGTTAGTADSSYPNTLLNVSIINNVGNVDILSLSDLTIDGMNWDCSDYTIYAGGTVDIQSDYTLNIGTDSTVTRLDNGHNVVIDAGADVILFAGGDINIENSEIYAGDNGGVGESSYTGGSIDINALGSVYISSGSDLSAYSGECSDGDVTINAIGDVSIYSSTIYADGSVDIESTGGTLYIGTDPYFDVTIDAGYDVTLSAYGDAYIYDTGITAGEEYGDVSFYRESDSYASDPDITTTGGGVSITAGGEADIEYSSIDLQGNISISEASVVAGDSEGGASLTIETFGSEFSLSSDSAYIIDSTITGNNIDINRAKVGAYGDVNILNHGSAYFYVNGYADVEGSTISLNNISISEATVYSEGGNVNITDDGGQTIYNGGGFDYSGSTFDVNDISINDAKVYATGDVNITDEGSVSLKAIDTSSGNLGGGNIDIEDSKIYAGYDYKARGSSSSGGSVNINAYNGTVYLYDDDIEATSGESTSEGSVSANVTSSGGYVNIYSSGTSDVEGTYISADNDVTIESGDTLYVGWFEGGNEIVAGGSVCLTSDYSDVDISEYEIYANGGSVNINAAGNVNVENVSDIEAYGDVNINSGVVYNPAQSDSSSGLGDVYISDSSVYAGENQDFHGGSVNIYAPGNVSIQDYSYIYASDDVNITSESSISVGKTSDFSVSANIDIEDSTIIAGHNFNEVPSVDGGSASLDGGDVNISADNGSVYLYDDDIEALSSRIGNGDVNIYGGTTVDVDYTDITADRDVNIESYDTLTLENGDDIEAGRSVNLTSDDGSVDVYDTYISTDTGDVNITASYAVDVENSDIDQSGSVNVTADAYVYLYDVYNCSEDDNSSDTYLTDWNIVSGWYVQIGADSDVSIYSSTIYAYEDVNINSGGSVSAQGESTPSGGNVDIEDTTIKAGWDAIDHNDAASYWGGSVTIHASGGYDYGTVYLSDDNIYAYSDQNGAGEGNGGNVTIYGDGQVDLENTYIKCDVNVNIESGYGDGDLYLGFYDLVDENGFANNTIDAGGSVTITGDSGNVVVAGYDINAYGSSDTLDAGNVTISALDGLVALENTHIYAAGDVNIEAGGSPGGYFGTDGDVALGWFDYYFSDNFDNNEIDAVGSVTLTSDYADVLVYDYGIYAGGDVNITAGGSVSLGEISTVSGNIDLEYSTIEAGDNDYATTGGNVHMNANTGNVSLYDDYVFAYAGDNEETGYININANGTADVEGSYIHADVDVNIESGGTLTVGVHNSPDSVNNGAWDTIIDAGNSVYLTSDNADVDVYSSKVNAKSGDVTISAATGLTVDNSTIDANTASGTVTLGSTSGQTTVQNGSSISAFYLTVNSADGILIDGTSGGSLSGHTMNLTSGNGGGSDTIAVSHEDLSSFQSVNIAGHTLDIEYTTFAAGSSVNLGSSSGTLNINNGVIPFDINLIQDHYGSTAITSAGQFTSGYSASAGLHNYAIP